jgi:glycosyltransferase involved in cell wall biosynthesis
MIALCMIVKGDEELNLDSVLEYVDHVFITTTQTHTGKNTKKITYSQFDWTDNFAEARNFNFNQASDYDYILWLDSDDVLEGGEYLQKIVSKMDSQKLDAIYADYNYEIADNGEIVIVHPRERIVRAGVFTWKGALHETLIPNRQVQTKYIKDIVVNHYPTKDSRKSGIERNLRILSNQYNKEVKEVAEGKKSEIDPRTEYYLARILFDLHTKDAHVRAERLFQDYLEHSGWDEERAQAWCYLGNIYYNVENFDDSVNCYLSAIKEKPDFPTWYIMLARTYAAKQDFDKALFYVKQGLNIPHPKTSLVISPREDKLNALLTLFFVYFNKQDLTKALTFAEKLYEMRPDKENERRVESIEKLIKWGDWLKAVSSMAEEMSDDKKYDRVRLLLSALPDDIRNTIQVSRLQSNFTKPTVWPDKSVVYYAASQFETWSPKNMDTGIGGSEEAIIYLAKEWVEKGYKVTVYANVGADEGTYDGVEYVNYQRFNPKDKFDVFIVWRNPLLLRHNLFDARLILVDLHDVPEPGEFDDKVLSNLDYIMVKSDYHRSLLPQIPNDKFKIIGNGIDLGLLGKAKGKNKRYKLFYGSSYDRGLYGLLKIWPLIKQAEPLAELHVCYGWNLYEKLYAHVPHMMAWKKEMEALLKQDGIIHHGRVGKSELYDIAKDCGIWAYPTTFEEIHCITGAYCQALGLVPCVYDYAALQTTVQHGVRLAVDCKKPESLKIYAKELIELIKDGNKQEIIRRNMNVDEYSWKNVANEWSKLFWKFKPQKEKVSIITPTIRTGWWNLMAHNLSKQTYQNFEWIIVDDHKDNRAEIAAKYAKKYGLDIKYTRGERAVMRKYGLSSANNVGWRKSKGELLVWLQDFVILPENAIERLVDVYRRHPNSLIAPVDEYRKMSVKPSMDKEDWFKGETDISGEFIRENVRIGLGELRFTDNPYDFEMNIGAIPKKVLDKLNGFWELFDDALGYDNTEIAMRAQKLGSTIIVDERLRVVCLDLWEHISGTDENGKDREWNLNDPRYAFLEEWTEKGKIPVVRNEKLDQKLQLNYEIPRDVDPVEWMKKNLEKIVKPWEKLL